MGLITGERYRRTVFYIYPSGEKGKLSNIQISLKGPYNSVGKAVVIWAGNMRKSTRRGSIFEECKKLAFKTTGFGYFSTNENTTDIPVKIISEPERVKVVFISKNTGVHELSLTTESVHIRGSPFNIQIMENTSGTVDKLDTKDEKIIRSSKTIIRKFKSKVIDFISEKVAYDDYQSSIGITKKPNNINVIINHVDNLIKCKKIEEEPNNATKEAFVHFKHNAIDEIDNPFKTSGNVLKTDKISWNIAANVAKTLPLSERILVDKAEGEIEKNKFENSVALEEKQHCNDKISTKVVNSQSINCSHCSDSKLKKEAKNFRTHSQIRNEIGEKSCAFKLNKNFNHRCLTVEQFNLATNPEFMKLTVKERKVMIENNSSNNNKSKQNNDKTIGVIPPLISLSVKERKSKIEEKISQSNRYTHETPLLESNCIYENKCNFEKERNIQTNDQKYCPDLLLSHFNYNTIDDPPSDSDYSSSHESSSNLEIPLASPILIKSIAQEVTESTSKNNSSRNFPRENDENETNALKEGTCTTDKNNEMNILNLLNYLKAEPKKESSMPNLLEIDKYNSFLTKSTSLQNISEQGPRLKNIFTERKNFWSNLSATQLETCKSSFSIANGKEKAKRYRSECNLCLDTSWKHEKFPDIEKRKSIFDNAPDTVEKC